jgi:septin family protein
LAKLKLDYEFHGKYPTKKVEHKNILLIGRTRTGKSTIKSLLIDPTNVPDDLTLKSGTKEPHFQAYHLQDNDIVLNIIDTPGLFEHSNQVVDIRDNEKILKSIGFCINMEITKFHAICFCVSLTTGINREDIQSLELLIEFFGPETSKNACLIITRSESLDEQQREKLRKELMEDVDFISIAPFFKLGVYFSGAINRSDLQHGNARSVELQYCAISEYREELIEQFLRVEDPLPIENMASSSKKFAEIYRQLLPLSSSSRSQTQTQINSSRLNSAYNKYN